MGQPHTEGEGQGSFAVAIERDRELLRGLLRRYNEQPDQRACLVAEIERRFARPLAILAIDSSGFSRTVRAVGIVHFLALLERLGRIVQPLIERHGGRLLRTEADNLFAAFPTVAAAVNCADALLRDLAAVNERLPEADQLYVSIGVGYGSVLVVDVNLLYGDEMNLACKLGEDLAQRDEVLLTPGARAALDPSPWQVAAVNFSISGIDLTAYRLVR